MTYCFFFFNDTATTEIYTLSLHDALPICPPSRRRARAWPTARSATRRPSPACSASGAELDGLLPGAAVVELQSGSEEHTSELQSRQYLVCRLLLEKKKNSE